MRRPAEDSRHGRMRPAGVFPHSRGDGDAFCHHQRDWAHSDGDGSWVEASYRIVERLRRGILAPGCRHIVGWARSWDEVGCDRGAELLDEVRRSATGYMSSSAHDRKELHALRFYRRICLVRSLE